jgi:hypothetical protein
MPVMKRTSLSVACALVVLAAVGQARAAGNEAAAEALFGEAKKLAAQGKFAEACPKFAESNRLDRGAGTLIHLGDCYEKNKQTASAWATYKEAASAAQALGRKDWEKLASQRATALEPKLAKLTVKVDKANDKIEVTRDGTSVSPPSYNVPIPVDSGAHTVEATAAGHKPFKTTATVTKDGETVEVSIPKLEPEPTAATVPAPTTKTPEPVATTPAKNEGDRPGDTQRTIGIAVGGVGVAGLAVGAITGLMAIGKSNDAKAVCPEDGRCANRDAVDASDSARTLGLVSTIGFIAGGVGLAAGAALYFTAAKGEALKTGRVRVIPSAGPDRSGGLTVMGVF